MNIMPNDWTVKEAIDAQTGTVHRYYSYKRKPCKRNILNTHLARQMAGTANGSLARRGIGKHLPPTKLTR